MKSWPRCGHDATPYQGHCLTPHCPYYLGHCDRHDRNQPALCTLKALALDEPLPDEEAAVNDEDPLDWITWVQYRAAFKIATEALLKIAVGPTLDMDPHAVAAEALQALRPVVRRFDESEPSWEPAGSAGAEHSEG